MALAKYIRKTESGKSAICMVRTNRFVFNASPVYIPIAAVEGIVKDQEFEIPDGYELMPWIDYETKKVRRTEEGIPLKVLSYDPDATAQAYAVLALEDSMPPEE